MEFSQELLIDWALTAAGYIAAGALAVVIYSMFRERRDNRTPARRAVPRFDLEAEAPARPPRPTITLTRGPEAAEPKAPTEEHETPSTYNRNNLLAQEGYRRNRTGAIRVARELVRAGATSEQIRAVLPISEAELAMLRQEAN